MEERQLVAYCGLYCGECFLYQGKVADLARDLRKELRQSKFDRTAAYLSSVSFFANLKDYPQCYQVLGTMVKLRCNKGCRGGGGSPACKMRICCQKKGIEGCWECEEFETCQKLDYLNTNHDDALLKNLRIISKKGMEQFLQGRKYW